MNKNKYDHRQEVTNTLIEMIEAGTAPWQKPWYQTLPRNVNGNEYKGGNSVYLLALSLKNGYDDSRWLTYNQAQKNGWQVRKGEKSAKIEFWQFDKIEKITNKITGEEEEIRVKLEKPICRFYSVFNGCQIDGIPPQLKPELKESDVLIQADKLIKDLGVNVEHFDLSNTASYSPTRDIISLPIKNKFKSDIDYFSTLTHEVAHWTGHESRLNRDMSGVFGSESYAREELRAEIASVFIQADLGLPHDTKSHAAYLDSWVSILKNDKNEIFKAAKDASSITDYVKELALKNENKLSSAIQGRPKATLTQSSTTNDFKIK